ncbi:PD40 domain-containing protein, partial [Tahibacter aquaticus]
MSIFRLVHQRCAGAARFALMLLALPGAAAAAQPFELVSQAAFPAAAHGNSYSRGPLDVSGDGRYVLFASGANNLVLNDYNERADLFLLDAQTGEMAIINSDAISRFDLYGVENASVSDDGRYVLYHGRPNGGSTYQVYRFDRLTHSSLLLSADASGIAGNNTSIAGGLSADGRYVVFISFAHLLPNAESPSVYRYDALTAQLQIVSVDHPTGATFENPEVRPEITPDGRYVTYGARTDRGLQLFIRDMDTGSHVQATVSSSGDPVPLSWPLSSSRPCKSTRTISNDGRYTVFVTEVNADPSDTDQNYDVYRYDRLSNTSELISRATSGFPAAYKNYCPAISGDGQRVLFLADSIYGNSSLVVNNTSLSTLHIAIDNIDDFEITGLSLSDTPGELFFTSLILPGVTGEQVLRYRDDSGLAVMSRAYAAGSESADGHSGDSAVNPSDRDLGPGVSADGRFVVFTSSAQNLVEGNSYANQIFLRDRTTGTTERINSTYAGSNVFRGANPSITPDSRYIVFSASRYVESMGNRLQSEIFRYDRTSGQTSLVSTDTSGTAADASSSGPHMS